VQAGTRVLSITEPTTNEAVVYVAVAAARDLEPGAVVKILSEGGQRAKARVEAVGEAVEPVPLRQARDPAVQEWGVPVSLTTLDRDLVPGEAMIVEF
jgi:hypothetical protein